MLWVVSHEPNIPASADAKPRRWPQKDASDGSCWIGAATAARLSCDDFAHSCASSCQLASRCIATVRRWPVGKVLVTACSEAMPPSTLERREYDD